MNKLMSAVLTGVVAGTIWLLPSIQKQPNGTASANPYQHYQQNWNPYIRPPFQQYGPILNPPSSPMLPGFNGIGGHLNILEGAPPNAPVRGFNAIPPGGNGVGYGGRVYFPGSGGLTGGYGAGGMRGPVRLMAPPMYNYQWPR